MGRLELPTGGLRMRRMALLDVPRRVFPSKFVSPCVGALPAVPRDGGQHGGQLDEDLQLSSNITAVNSIAAIGVLLLPPWRATSRQNVPFRPTIAIWSCRVLRGRAALLLSSPVTDAGTGSPRAPRPRPRFANWARSCLG